MSEQEQQATFSADKHGLVAQILAARAALWLLVDGLSDADMTVRHDAQGWTAKDHLIHLALWQNGITALLGHQPRWSAMGLTAAEIQVSDDADALNALLQPRYANMTAQEVRQYLHAAEAALDTALAPLSTEDLRKSYSFYAEDQPDNDTVVAAYVMGNSCGHYNEHLPWLTAIVDAQ